MTDIDDMPPDDEQRPEDFISPEEMSAIESDIERREIAALKHADPKNWTFDIDDPEMFLADPDFELPEDQVAHAEQEEEIQDIVDEETLNAAVEKWFNSEMRFATPIVEGLLFRGSITAVYGASHSGKTLAVMSLVSSVARGVPFGDLGVRQGPVVYLNSESAGDFNKRTMAICEATGIDHIPNFRAMHSAFDVRDPYKRAILLASLPKIFGDNHRPPIFVFDTLAQHLAGVEGEAIDENSTKDMGRYIFGLRDLAEKTNGVIILVAHSGKDGERGIRGSSALRAALDTEVRVEGVKHQNMKLIKLAVTKQRFGDMLDPACYRIQSIILKQFEGIADQPIDDDDVMIKPVFEENDFRRSVAPSNQSAVMDSKPMPVPARGEDEEDDGRKLTRAQITMAENVQRILSTYFQGARATRKDIMERWLDDGLNRSSFSKAVMDAVKKGLIVELAGGILQTAAGSTPNGNIGSAADIAKEKAADAFARAVEESGNDKF